VVPAELLPDHSPSCVVANSTIARTMMNNITTTSANQYLQLKGILNVHELKRTIIIKNQNN